MTQFNLHLVSDATGETLVSVAKAALVQFESAEPVSHLWSMIRNRKQLNTAIEAIEAEPGLVMFTLVDHSLREELQNACRRMQVPCVPVLDPVLAALANFLGAESREQPGRQHVMDSAYFDRIDAMHFCMAHDDGQGTHNLNEADVVLVGVSRTSKTPTCVYLANRGIKAANVPIVPEIPLPAELDHLTRPLVIGLTASPDRLVQIRRNRLLSLKQQPETDYVDPALVRDEIGYARKLFAKRDWPVIDVTRRSIEETAAAIISLHNQRLESRAGHPAD
jgi:regulator of PEP synthase PpsR (kinase-PPPase family)